MGSSPCASITGFAAGSLQCNGANCSTDPNFSPTTCYNTDYPGGLIQALSTSTTTAGSDYTGVLSSYKNNNNPSIPWATDVSGLATFLSSVTLTGTGYTAISNETATPYNPLTGLGSRGFQITETFSAGVDITALSAQYSNFLAGISGEYAYYSALYYSALNDYFYDTASTSALQAANTLNFKLITLLYIYETIITQLQGTYQAGGTGGKQYKALLTEIAAAQTALGQQKAGALSSQLATQNEMVAFTEEKNRTARNQLIFYGGLCAVAVAVLAALVTARTAA